MLPELHCAICSFPEVTTQIHIGNFSYINKCTYTNVWIDHDFILGFVTLLSHYAHLSVAPLVGTDKSLPQLVYAPYNKTTLSISGGRSIPIDAHKLVALLHNKRHYIVLEVNILGRIFKIYDGLSRELLQWKDHVVLVIKKYVLLDVSYASLSTICIPDAAPPPAASRSRRPRYTINGYSFTFPWFPQSDKKCDPWQLERGYFIHQNDGFNCGPIACLKLMELYDVVSVPDPQAFSEKNYVCKIITPTNGRYCLSIMTPTPC